MERTAAALRVHTGGAGARAAVCQVVCQVCVGLCVSEVARLRLVARHHIQKLSSREGLGKEVIETLHHRAEAKQRTREHTHAV